jgi:hypothetical protein
MWKTTDAYSLQGKESGPPEYCAMQMVKGLYSERLIISPIGSTTWRIGSKVMYQIGR